MFKKSNSGYYVDYTQWYPLGWEVIVRDQDIYFPRFSVLFSMIYQYIVVIIYNSLRMMLIGQKVININPWMRHLIARGNDLTKLNRQVQLWVCQRFEPPTPHLCMISYTGREPVFLLSFIPSASCRSNSFNILSPSPLRGVETPQQVYQPQTDPEYPLKLSSQQLRLQSGATLTRYNYFNYQYQKTLIFNLYFI